MCTNSTLSSVVIEELRTVFAKFGLPETIVTDNGTGFVSQEFETFLQKNGIKHVTSAPYHPASNGLAERAVQIVKRGLKKVIDGSVNTRLAKVLFNYRITPQATTGISPSELMLGRRPRTRLDLCKPHTAVHVEEKQLQQKVVHNKKAKARLFMVGDQVFVKNFSGNRIWLPGEIVKKTGPVLFHVHLEDGRVRRCHQDQIWIRSSGLVEQESKESQDTEEVWDSSGFTSTSTTNSTLESADIDTDVTDVNIAPENVEDIVTPTVAPTATPEAPETETIPPNSETTIVRSYPCRIRKPRTFFEPGKDQCYVTSMFLCVYVFYLFLY